jgi:hypothetical protein
MKKGIVLILVIFPFVLVYLGVVANPVPAVSSDHLIITNPTNTPTLSPTPTITPTTTPCPRAPPEPLWVEPVNSPTELLTQTIQVYAGNSEWVTIETGFDIFTTTIGYTMKDVEINLRPQQTHQLLVSSKVRQIELGDCVYGGYVLSTLYDRYGALLVIVQESEVQYLPLISR